MLSITRSWWNIESIASRTLRSAPVARLSIGLSTSNSKPTLLPPDANQRYVEATNVPPDAALVVHSPAYDRAANPELIEAARRGLPILSYPEALGEISRQFDEDLPIWENKIFLERPVLCDGDGPIGAMRRWGRQFY